MSSQSSSVQRGSSHPPVRAMPTVDAIASECRATAAKTETALLQVTQRLHKLNEQIDRREIQLHKIQNDLLVIAVSCFTTFVFTLFSKEASCQRAGIAAGIAAGIVTKNLLPAQQKS